jgi:hypothetical protein
MGRDAQGLARRVGQLLADLAEADGEDAVNKTLTGHPHLAMGSTAGIYQVLDMGAP